jgi:hypothetical protein
MLLYEACIEGNQHRFVFLNERERRGTKPLEIVRSNIYGPMKTTSMGSARYLVNFIDNFSWNVWLYVLKTKGDCFEKFKEFKGLVKT